MAAVNILVQYRSQTGLALMPREGRFYAAIRSTLPTTKP